MSWADLIEDVRALIRAHVFKRSYGWHDGRALALTCTAEWAHAPPFDKKPIIIHFNELAETTHYPKVGAAVYHYMHECMGLVIDVFRGPSYRACDVERGQWWEEGATVAILRIVNRWRPAPLLIRETDPFTIKEVMPRDVMGRILKDEARRRDLVFDY